MIYSDYTGVIVLRRKPQRLNAIFFISYLECIIWAFPGGSDHKEPACNTGDPGSVAESGRASGGENDRLENPMD